VSGTCKFCGCSENRPCFIPATCITDPGFVVAGNVVPCAWLLDDVCTAPACVERAYAECRIDLEEIARLHPELAAFIDAIAPAPQEPA
jgi:hypothetical protein